MNTNNEQNISNDLNDIFLDVNNTDKNKNSFQNEKIIKLQENLLMMGFDIDMINKIITYFNIQTEDEAIDYLIKSPDGKWNHPFVEYNEQDSKVYEEITNNNIFDNALNRVKTLNMDSINQKDICQICGENKDTHINIQNKNNINNNLDYYNNLFFSDNDLFFNNNNNKENNNENNEDNDDNICHICLDTIKNEVKIEKCSHKFCSECFENYLNNLININNIENIPCPEKKCNNKSLSPDFFSQYISEQQLIKYQNFKIQNEIARSKLKIFCPICNSYANIDNPDKYNPNNISYKKSKLICQNGHAFCSCGSPEHEGDCYHEGKEFKNLIIKEKIKKCPKCGFLIKKNSGCNLMTCGNKACKYEFCWLCLQESLPGHYEQGGCEGKQFVDPDSIFYQLEQKFPFLYYVFWFFKIILIILIFCIFFGFPALPLWTMMGFILYDNYIAEDNDEDKLFILSKSLSIFHYIICIFICFSLQNLFYVIFVLSILYLIITGILYLIHYCIGGYMDDD